MGDGTDAGGRFAPPDVIAARAWPTSLLVLTIIGAQRVVDLLFGEQPFASLAIAWMLTGLFLFLVGTWIVCTIVAHLRADEDGTKDSRPS